MAIIQIIPDDVWRMDTSSFGVNNYLAPESERILGLLAIF